MTISEAVQKRPRRIARNLVTMYRDDAEEVLYLAGDIRTEFNSMSD